MRRVEPHFMSRFVRRQLQRPLQGLVQRLVVAVCLVATLGCGERGSGDGPKGTLAQAPPGDSTMLARGEALFWRDQFDSARAVFRTVLVEAEAHADSVVLARALFWLARAAREQGNYELARTQGEAALQLRLRLHRDAELFDSWNILGLLAWNQGRLVEAESLLTAAARAAAAVADHLSVGKASGNLGLVKVELGDYSGAREGLEAMLAAGRAARDARVEANALANLAMLDIREGNPSEAMPRLVEARRKYATIGYRTGEANALGQLATAWQALGDYTSAFAAADSALALAREVGLQQEAAAELEVIAMLHRETGDLSSAMRRLEAAQAINSALDLRVETGTDHRRTGEIALQLGRRAAAIADGQRALEVHATAGAQPERLADLLFLADADSARSNHWLQLARALADSMGSRRGQGEVELESADLALARGDASLTLAQVSVARKKLGEGDAMTRWHLALLEARALLGLRRLADGERAARQAVVAVERVRGSLGPAWSRARFLASRAGTYETLVTLLLARGKVDAAFAVSDAARGRALLEHLAGLDSTEGPRGSVLARLAARERSLRRIDELEQVLAISSDDATLDAGRTRERLQRALLREREVNVSNQQADFTPADLLGTAPADTRQLQRALHGSEALVEYLVGEARVHLFVVTRGAVRYLSVASPPGELATRVRVARDVTGHARSREESAPVLAALYAQLIAPARDSGWLRGVTRLIVVPHGALSYVPFTALFDAARGRYLVEDFALITAPSASVLVALRRPRGATSAASAGVVAVAPFPRQLPGTLLEVDGIARLVPRSDKLLGAYATEDVLRSPAVARRVLHLATHGALNADNPLYSRIELRPSVIGNGDGDGRLEVHEVLALHLDSPLVYLSGCETALGQLGLFTQGDDFLSLAQAFLFAGSRSVVATLWRIPDAGSATLVEAFYRHAIGRDPVEALALAQRELIASSKFATPYYWAGHVLMGGGSSVPAL